MKVLTHRPLPSRVMLMSTGRGILDGSPMVPTSLAAHWPFASCLTSHSFEVSAAAVIAQLSFGLSDQRISSGAPGTGSTLVGFIVFRDRKSTRLNSSHLVISYAVFCLKKKKKEKNTIILLMLSC